MAWSSQGRACVDFASQNRHKGRSIEDGFALFASTLARFKL